MQVEFSYTHREIIIPDNFKTIWSFYQWVDVVRSSDPVFLVEIFPEVVFSEWFAE